MIHLGDAIPDFVAAATNFKNVRLNTLRGYQVLLYFYPKDASPACTIENQNFAANYAHFKQHNTLVFGVNRDSLESHERFKAAQSLPFELISDGDGQLCTIFGVLKEKQFFGKPILSINRSSFLIDDQGKLLQEWRDVDIKDHVHDVLNFLDQQTKLDRPNSTSR